jgi:hypothetical protein
MVLHAERVAGQRLLGFIHASYYALLLVHLKYFILGNAAAGFPGCAFGFPSLLLCATLPWPPLQAASHSRCALVVARCATSACPA